MPIDVRDVQRQAIVFTIASMLLVKSCLTQATDCAEMATLFWQGALELYAHQIWNGVVVHLGSSHSFIAPMYQGSLYNQTKYASHAKALTFFNLQARMYHCKDTFLRFAWLR
jgi:hypothetical protein